MKSSKIPRKYQLSINFLDQKSISSISRIMILIPTLVFWISDPKSIFSENWSEKVKAICFTWKLARTHTHTPTHTHTHTHSHNLEDADSYFQISFLKFQTYIHFLGKFELKKLNSPLYLENGIQTVLRMWLYGYRVRFGSKYKNE